MRAAERVERGHCEASSSGYGYPRNADDLCWADTAHEEETSCPEHGGLPLPDESFGWSIHCVEDPDDPGFCTDHMSWTCNAEDCTSEDL